MVKKNGKLSYEYSRAEAEQELAKSVATVVEPVESYELHKSVAEDLTVKDPDGAAEIIESNKEEEEQEQEKEQEKEQEQEKVGGKSHHALHFKPNKSNKSNKKQLEKEEKEEKEISNG